MSKRKSGAFSMLNGAGSSRHHKRDKGILRASNGLGRRGRKKRGGGKGLAGALDMGFMVTGGKSKRRQRGGFIRAVKDSLSTRLTPTERYRIADETERAIDDDQWLKQQQNEAGLTRDERFIRRLVRLIRERTARRTTL